MSEGLLAVEGMRAGYGDAVVLDDISLEVPEHGSLAVLGRNGVGKSTLLLSIMGYTDVSRGRVLWRGARHHRHAAAPPRPRGLGWVAQEREIFPSLTVEENLTVASRPGRWDLRRPSTACFRAWPSGVLTWATSSREASSRCWRSPAR